MALESPGRRTGKFPTAPRALTQRGTMAPSDKEPLKITLDDLAKVVIPQDVSAAAIAAPTAGGKSYGTITEAADKAPAISEERGSFLLQGWFYLGAAGLLGAVLGGGLCEPGFVDAVGAHRWGNTWLVPVIIILMCVGFGVAESAVERSAQKALLRGVLALPLGTLLGFLFYFIANILYNILLGL